MINSEFFEALKALEKERGVPMTYMIEKIQNAVSIAVKRDVNGGENNIVEIDPEKERLFVAVRKQVVERVEDQSIEIGLSAAREIKPDAVVGDIIEIELEPKLFGERIAAMSAKQ
jgi:N utilization substance protein A